MKENKKAILEILKKKSKKDGKFESLVLNLALQKIDSDSFEFAGDAVYTADKKRLVYCMSQEASFIIPEGVTTIGEMAFRGKKQLKSITIANSVREIEHDAFYDCDELDNVYVPEGVKEIKGTKSSFQREPAKLSAKPCTLLMATPTTSSSRSLPTRQQPLLLSKKNRRRKARKRTRRTILPKIRKIIPKRKRRS